MVNRKMYKIILQLYFMQGKCFESLENENEVVIQVSKLKLKLKWFLKLKLFVW